MMEHWETPEKDIYRDTSTGEETEIEHAGDTEYGMKTLPSSLPDVEEHIMQLKKEGWKIFKRGERFIVLEHEGKKGSKPPTYH